VSVILIAVTTPRFQLSRVTGTSATSAISMPLRLNRSEASYQGKCPQHGQRQHTRCRNLSQPAEPCSVCHARVSFPNHLQIVEQSAQSYYLITKTGEFLKPCGIRRF
jgi:hypothetical protein